MTGAALNHRLATPSRQVDLAGLCDIWQHRRIVIRVIGMGRFATAPSLLNKVRGALGHVLLQMGSDDVLDRMPCDWTETCAAEGLFRPKPIIAVGPQHPEITKPFRLSAKRYDQDLIVALDLFGFADVWRDEIKWALLQSLRKHVDWRALAKDDALFVPSRIQVAEPVVQAVYLSKLDPELRQVRVVFQTPIDIERGDLREHPQLFFERLFIRVGMIARWHEVELNESWNGFKALWDRLEYSFLGTENGSMQKVGGHKYRNQIRVINKMEIEGNLNRLTFLLTLGEAIGVGRGATIGLGNFELAPVVRT